MGLTCLLYPAWLALGCLAPNPLPPPPRYTPRLDTQELGLWMKHVEEELVASKSLVEEMQSNFA